jgi:hypothetical protein
MIVSRRGLGSTNVEPIAQALMAGALHPTFQTTYYQPPYLPPGTQTEAPSWMYMDAGSAGQIASLLGGSVFQSPPPNLPGAPAANWIRLGDGGQVMPGNLMQPGTVLSFGDLCAAENYFAQSIPGGIPGSHCGGPGAPAPVANAVQSAPVAVRNSPPMLGTQGRPIPMPSETPSAPLPVVTPASGSSLPAAAIQASSLPPSASQVVTGTPGASPAAGGTNPSTTTVSGSWFTDPTQEMISGVPNWALLAAAALGLWALNSGKGR